MKFEFSSLKTVPLSIFLFFILGQTIAQTPTIQWEKTIGGSSSDALTLIQQTSDGGYIAGGYSNSNRSNEKAENSRGSNDFWVVKLNSSNNIEWQKTIGGSGDDGLLYSLQQTTDGGYILGGYSDSNAAGDKTENSRGSVDYWVIKLKSNGDIDWDKTIGGSGFDKLYALQQTSDGGYILGGVSESNATGDKTENKKGGSDYWIVKLNSNGRNIDWQKTIGGTGSDILYSLQQTTDGGYILGGYSDSNATGDKTENSRGLGDYWVVKLNSNGRDIDWQKTIGGTGSDNITFLQQTSDGGYLVGGTSNSNASNEKMDNSYGSDDYWVVKLNSNGRDIDWQKTIGGNGFDILYSFHQTSDGGYILGGSSDSNISGSKTENTRGMEDYWVVKLNNMGTIQWQKTLGGSGSDNLTSLHQTSDGKYILGGYSNSNSSVDKAENSRGLEDFWIIKLESCTLSAPLVGTITQPTCLLSTGSVVLSGLPTGSWVINPGSITGSTTSTTITGLTAGSYRYTVATASGCTSSATANIVINAPPLGATTPSVSATPTSICSTQSTTLKIESGALNSASTWQWYSGSCGGTQVGAGNTLSVSPTTTTTYYVRGEGGNCPAGSCGQVTVTINPAIIINTPTTSNNCNAATANINLVWQNGTAPFTVKYGIGNPINLSSNNITTRTHQLSNLPAGTYTILVQDARGCETTTTAILNPSLPLSIQEAATGPTCSQTNGSLTIIASNGKSPYTYRWSTGATTATINNLAAGTYNITVTDANSCTVSKSINLACVPAACSDVSVTRFDTICEGRTFVLPRGNIVTTAGTYRDTFKVSTCDSIIITNLAVNASGRRTLTPSVCGTSYALPSGRLVTSSGTYVDTLRGRAASGCDSIYTINLTLNANPIAQAGADVSLCEGRSTTLTATGGVTYTWNNGLGTGATKTVSPITTTTYIVTVTNSANCSASDAVIVTVIPKIRRNITASICIGQTYNFLGHPLSISGNYADSTAAANGCDSVIQLTLVVNDSVVKNVSISINQGQTYTLPSGVVVNSAGIYRSVLQQRITNCDSIIYTNLSVVSTCTNSTITKDTSACEGTTITVRGRTFVLNRDTSFRDSFRVSTCDSIIISRITAKLLARQTLTPSVCATNYRLPDGRVVTSSGTYTAIRSGAAANGCDSVYTINLTLKDSIVRTVSASINQGQTYTLPSGGVVSVAGTYRSVLIRTNGCDSIIYINLSVIGSTCTNSTITKDTSACQGTTISVRGRTFVLNRDTSFRDSFRVSTCDSIIISRITAKLLARQTLTPSVCATNYRLPDGRVVTSSGTYTVIRSGAAANGCDSVYTINLTLKDSIVRNVSASINQGQTYTLPSGGVVSVAGTYRSVLIRANGCDSIIYINLSVIGSTCTNSTITKDTSACQGTTISVRGRTFVLNRDTSFRDSFRVSTCDSIIISRITAKLLARQTLTPSVCATNYRLPDGRVVTSSGTYTAIRSGVAANGCDSVYTINLILKDSIVRNVSASINQGQIYTLPGGVMVSSGGTYRSVMVRTNGCDSIIYTNLSIVATCTSSITTKDTSACEGTTMILRGRTFVLNRDTSFKDTFRIRTCDSIIISRVTAKLAARRTLTPSVCATNYRLPDGRVVTSSGTYTAIRSGAAANGCDSIYTVNLTIKPILAPSLGTVTQPTCTSSTGSVVLNDLPSTGTWTLTRNPDGVTTTGSGISSTITALAVGTYTFAVTNSANCISPASSSITINAVPTKPTAPSVGKLTLSICDSATGSVVLNDLPATGTWTINPKSITGTGTSTTINGLPAGSHSYTVTNAAGCTSAATVVLITCVKDKGETCIEALPNIIPNGFTPGGNGANDLFDPDKYLNVAGCSNNVKSAELYIFNRWGEIIFKAVPYEQWDGKSASHRRTAPSGAYYYVFVLNIDGVRKSVKGVLNLFAD